MKKNLIKQMLSICLVSSIMFSSIDMTAFAQEDSVGLNAVATEINTVNTSEQVSETVNVNNEYVLMLYGTNAKDALSNLHTKSITEYDSVYILSYSKTNDYNTDLEYLNTIDGVSVEKNELVQTETEVESISSNYDEAYLSDLGFGGDYSNFYLDEESGQDVTVAIIDTGIDTLNLDAKRIKTDSIYDFADVNNSIDDKNGHGTYMSQIILNYTPENVKVLPIKSVDDTGKGTVLSVYLGIKAAIEENVDVINISLSNNGHSQMLTDAINEATENWIPVIVAAGNNGTDVNGFIPGNIDASIAVSAVESNNSLATYSNYGDKIDYSAYGNAKIINLQGNEEIVSGTSVAAAYTSVGFAMIETYQKSLEVKTALSIMNNNISDIGDEGFDTSSGNGLINLSNFYFGDKTRKDREDAIKDKVEDESKLDESYTEDDANQELYPSTSKTKDFWVNNLGDGYTIEFKKMSDDSFFGGVFFLTDNWDNTIWADRYANSALVHIYGGKCYQRYSIFKMFLWN